MNLGHPALKDMINLGCKNQARILLGFQTYIELCEIHKAQDVSYHYCPELDIIYLKTSNNGEEEIYISLSQRDTISPRTIKSFQELLLKAHAQRSMNLVVRDVDSTNVVYKITNGLEKPLAPEVSKEKKDLKEKWKLIDNEITNLLPSLVEEARSKQKVA